jgi:hypothetical protein
MGEELFEGEGISRREMLKRSAIVGGASAMVWAAPSVTTFAPRAFGTEGTPVSDFSAFGALITCVRQTESGQVTTTYRVKANQSGALPNITWEDPAGQNIGNCFNSEDLATFKALFQASTTVGIGGDKLGIIFEPWGTGYKMTLPETSPGYGDCEFTFYGGAAAVIKQSNCCLPATTNGGKTIYFTGLEPNPNKEDVCLANGGYWVGN